MTDVVWSASRGVAAVSPHVNSLFSDAADRADPVGWGHSMTEKGSNLVRDAHPVPDSELGCTRPVGLLVGLLLISPCLRSPCLDEATQQGCFFNAEAFDALNQVVN